MTVRPPLKAHSAVTVVRSEEHLFNCFNISEGAAPAPALAYNEPQESLAACFAVASSQWLSNCLDKLPVQSAALLQLSTNIRRSRPSPSSHSGGVRVISSRTLHAGI